MPKPPIGPSRLSQVLQKLKADPKPALSPSLRSLKLTYAKRNAHFGARHFVKEELPRIQYANPTLEIEVNKAPNSREDTWQSSLIMEFNNGSKKSFTMDDKWSTGIFTDLMDMAGTPTWDKWKADRKAANLPVLEGPQGSPKPSSSPSTTKRKTGAAAVLP